MEDFFYQFFVGPFVELGSGFASAGTVSYTHLFMNYSGPILTDSGGFQVFSLADTLKLDEDGLTFKSIYDGSKIRWTPESNMEIQQKLGADIVMQLDQCTPYPCLLYTSFLYTLCIFSLCA